MSEDDLKLELHYKAREEAYRGLQDSKGRAFDLQGQYGRWLISTLLLIHGVGIGFIAKDPRLASLLIPWIFSEMVAGLLLALLCGFITWINWSLHAVQYESVNPAMIYDDEVWPKFDEPRGKWISLTFWLSLVAGVASSILILVAAIHAAVILNTPAVSNTLTQ
jgi:hypothetical protein